MNFYDPIFWDDLNKGRRGEAQRRKIEDFFRLLAVCHSVTPEKDEKTHEVRIRHTKRTRRDGERAVALRRQSHQRWLGLASDPPFRRAVMCHQIKFSASSPDDEALVCAAKFFGFRFEGRREGAAQVRTNYGVENFKYVHHHSQRQRQRQRQIEGGWD